MSACMSVCQCSDSSNVSRLFVCISACMCVCMRVRLYACACMVVVSYVCVFVGVCVFVCLMVLSILVLVDERVCITISL